MIPRNDHHAMAASAFRLLDDSELAVQIARQAREASRKFTWAAVKDEWLKLYCGLVSPKMAQSNTQTMEVQATLTDR